MPTLGRRRVRVSTSSATSWLWLRGGRRAWAIGRKTRPFMYRHSKENWVPDFIKRRPDASTDMIQKYLHNLYAVQPDFLYPVSRDFIRNCRTPMLVLPDDAPGHPLQTSIDVAALAPNAEITVYPWKEPEELRQRTI